MSRVSEYLTYGVAKLIYCILGLKVDQWRKKVEDIWSSGDKSRTLELEKLLSVIQPIDGSEKTIQTLDDLEYAVPVSKAKLMERISLRRTSGVFKRYTSGTSGKRTEVFLNKEEIGRMLAVRDYCYRYYGVRLGEKEARIWGSTNQSFASVLKDGFLNRRSFSVAGNDVELVVTSLKKWKPKYIYGYSSLIVKLAKFLEGNQESVGNIKLVVCTAEQILPAQKKYLSEVFCAPVVEEYGSTEFDVVGFEDKDGNLRTVNPWLVLETNERNLLISDVSRVSQSFIRYELGDVANLIIQKSNGFGGDVTIESLEGRSANRFALLHDNNSFHASEFSRAMNDYFETFSDVFDFTVVQEELGKFIIFINKLPKLGLPHFKQKLREYLNIRIGCNIQMEFKVRAELSGARKRTYFIQNIKVD